MVTSFSKFCETFTPKKTKERMQSTLGREIEQKDHENEPDFDNMVKMFKDILDDEKKHSTDDNAHVSPTEGEYAYVPLTDWEYYATQIENIYDLSKAKSTELAKKMATTLNTKTFETFVPKKLDRTLIKNLETFKTELQKLLPYKLTAEELETITDFNTAQDVMFDNADVDINWYDEDESEVEAAETEQANEINALIYKAISNSNKKTLTQR